jgi:hypothetical protein
MLLPEKNDHIFSMPQKIDFDLKGNDCIVLTDKNHFIIAVINQDEIIMKDGNNIYQCEKEPYVQIIENSKGKTEILYNPNENN